MNQPELYSRNNAIQERENNYFIDKYLGSETWKSGESILEIGSGDGKYTVETFLPRLPRNLKRYVVSDISEEMVKFAERKYGKHTDANIEFRILDGQSDEIPFDFIGQFDHVLSFLCFHWFTDSRKAAQNIFAMLKPGGKLAAFFLERNTAGDIFLNMSKYPIWGRYGHGEYVSDLFWSEDPQAEWKKILTEAGFVDIRTFSEDRTRLFPNEESFNGFYMAIDPVSAKIPEKDKKTYIENYLREAREGKLNFVKQNKDTGKQEFGMEYKLLYFIASKPAVAENSRSARLQ